MPAAPGVLRGGLPLVAIVGRPNVGKSTLFNRLTRSRRSIVGDEPGITRDRIYGEYDWAGRSFRLVDTGGIVPDDPELIPAEIYNQAKVALDEADALVLVVDARTELASPDYDLVRLLLRGGKPLFLAVNKVEGEAMALVAENFRRLGIRNVFPISSEHGLGIGELLDAISEAIPAPSQTESQPGGSQPAEDSQAAVEAAEEDEIYEGGPLTPGSARPRRKPAENPAKPPHPRRIRAARNLRRHHRPPQRWQIHPAQRAHRNRARHRLARRRHHARRRRRSGRVRGRQFRFVDTAGIRRKGKTHLMAEKLSVVMARRHLEAADVALLVIDATEGVTASDATIGGYAHESGRSVIIVVNKWDAVTTGRTDGKPPADRDIFERQLRTVLKYLSYAPVIFLSALEGTGARRQGSQKPCPPAARGQSHRRRAPQARHHRPDEPLPRADRLPARAGADGQTHAHLLYDPGRRRPAHLRPLH